MKDHPKSAEKTKSFEDAAFEMLSTVSPVKLPREEIPFDSVRQIVLNEVIKTKQQQQKLAATTTTAKKNMDSEMPLEEGPSSSSSSSHAGAESNSSNLDRATMTDEVEAGGGTPRPISARLYGDCTRSSSTSTSSAAQMGPSNSTDPASGEVTKKKPMNYREKRLAEIRTARMKKYRENVEIVEFKCEEISLSETFLKFYDDLLDDDSTPPTLYFRIVESLDVYFRAKTWENNCPKLLCEFLCEFVLKTCQQLNEFHDSRNSPDEFRAKECQVQVLLTLHVFVVTDEKKWLNEAINKLRMIYISVGAEKLKNFVEEPVTDIYSELIGDGLATIYDELCITLPADLQQYDNGLFKMTESDDAIVVKRRNGAANRLEAMLMETSADYGIGGVERTRRTEEVPVRKSLKRKTKEEVPKELLSPVRNARSNRADYKQFFVEETPDEKYAKKTAEESDEEDEGKSGRKRRIKEEIDEEVKQTPVAKLRANAAKSGKRCSKRLSDLVKLSEERNQMTRRAHQKLDEMLQKAQEVTPSRSAIRPIRKSVLFGATPVTSASRKATTSSRSSLLSKFSNVVSSSATSSSSSQELSIDTSEDVHDSPSTSSASEATTPVLRERRRPARYSGESTMKSKLRIKQEVEDSEFDEIESRSPSKKTTTTTSSAASTPSGHKWTDRQLKRQLGLTREDLNRYREAMLTTGQRSRNNVGKNEKIKWESAQVNRAGRVKASEIGSRIFGIPRRNVRTMICHVLLNDTNPDTSFDWNKVKFDEIGDKPRTRQFQSLIQKPEAFMESLKQKYMKSKVSSVSPQKPPIKRRRLEIQNSTSSTDSWFDDNFGFESEADD